MIIDILENITYTLPSFLSLFTAITVYYKQEKNMITFLIAIVKSIILLSTCIYLVYLYVSKGQTTRQTDIKLTLINSYLTLIFTMITIMLLLKDYNFKQQLDDRINGVKKYIKKLNN